MTGSVGDSGAARAAEQADQIAAQQTAKAEQQDVKADVAKERLQDFLSERGDLLKKDQKKDKKDLKKNANRIKRGQMGGEKMGEKKDAKEIRNKAAEYAKRNPELDQGKLERLARDHLKQGDSSDDIQKKLAELYDDVSLRDEALEFLEETTEGELSKEVSKAREELNEESGREIKAGRNIGTEARRFAKEGLGSPTALRDLYRDLVHNPRNSRELFKEMSGRFKFEELKKVSDFLFHSLGKDLKSQGPSIPRGLLHRLITEARSLQAVLGVYSFFRGRMSLVRSMFANGGIPLPKTVNFESLAKAFMEVAQERYPSSDKILRSASRLGIGNILFAKIVIISQMRDGVREVALDQIFLSVQQRNDLLTAILETLEELEDEYEEEIDEYEDIDEPDADESTQVEDLGETKE